MNIPEFRAWFPDSKQLVQVDQIDFYNGCIVFDHFEDEEGEVMQSTRAPLKDCILLQSTGLKDKRGINIFEGSIVRWDDGSKGTKWRVAVVEQKRALQFRIIRIKCDFEQSAKEGYVFSMGSFMYADTENHLEVIGNIYENADILV